MDVNNQTSRDRMGSGGGEGQSVGNVITSSRFFRYSVQCLLLFSGVLIPQENQWRFVVDGPRVKTIMEGLRNKNLGLGYSGPHAIGDEANPNSYAAGIMEGLQELTRLQGPGDIRFSTPDQAVDHFIGLLNRTSYGKTIAA